MLDDFEALKRRVAEVTSRRDKAAGALEQTLKKIKEKYGCKTLEAAEALLVEKEKTRQEAAEKYAAKKQKFEKAWKAKLEELE